ncbi:type I-E CRISPR-associated protein Cse2/CasB [Streptomyces griseoruber]
MTTTPSVTADVSIARRQRLAAYTDEIERICRDDPGARTALRSGLRRGLNEVPHMHRFVVPRLPYGGRVPESEQRAYYAVAAMIAAQPRSAYTAREPSEAPEPTPEADTTSPPPAQRTPAARHGSSLGLAFAVAETESPNRERGMRESAAESRLNLLTRQSVNGLHRHVPAAVGYLRNLDVPVDWAQLLADLIDWPVHSSRISRRWLQDFYRQRTKAQQEQADRADQDGTESTNTETSTD